jgi:hypothetical protein
MDKHYDMIANLYTTTKNELNTTDVYDIACEMSKRLSQTLEDTISDLQTLYNKGFKL